MKNTIIILTIAIFSISCENDDNKRKANACFDYYPKSDIRIGDTLKFTNCSENAIDYLWHFGDNSTSTKKLPVIIFTNSGLYTIKLQASNSYSNSTITKSVNIRELTVAELLNRCVWSCYKIEYKDNSFDINIPSKDIEYVNFTFNNDGSFKFEMKLLNKTELIEGKWTVSDTTLITSNDGQESKITIKENTLQNLILEDPSAIMYFKPIAY